MTTVYCNFGFAHLLNDLPIQFEPTVEQFLASSGKKVAVCFIPFPYDQLGQQFEQTIDQLLTGADHMVVLGSELHDRTVDFIRRYQNPKITFLLCGQVQGLDHGLWLDWFERGTAFYRNSLVLEQLNPHQVKPKTFDILLGLNRPHRDILYNYINQNRLNDRVVMTYINNNESIPWEDSSTYIWEDGLELPNKSIKYTVTPVKYHGQELTLSQVVPIKIYNQTAYSVVAETNFARDYVFHTEKIVKPILARRLFIVFGGCGYLAHLRQLGFQTFGDIIDESYDLEPDFKQRGQMICEQIKYLISQPQELILEQIKPIVEHNYNLIINNNWTEQFNTQLRNIIL